MTDVYGSLGALARNIEAIDAQIADLQKQRGEIESQIRAVALQLVTTKPSVHGAPGTQLKLIGSSDLPARQVRLLKLLTEKPGLDSSAIAKSIYGDTERSSRTNVSSEFSRLKAGGYVESAARGIFEITEKGRAALR